ncbi:MAG: DUF1573 domain-containing protein [Gemmataceae bacterium]|nr:DUF1573 domain-containing protein [Gemmata sp.]MDW8199112.1 DUF1573 domain-containing protein [Gemmataceae bacterium]
MNTLIVLSGLIVGQPASLPASFHSPQPVAAKGEVKAGPPLVHTFDLVNTTDKTVTITKIEAGCGCFRQSLGHMVLPPGQKTQLLLEVNTLTQPEGPNRWQAVVSYKLQSAGDPDQSGELLLQITATLIREVIIQPPQMAFSASGAATQTLTITDKRPKPLTVKKVTTSAPYLTAELVPVANTPAEAPQLQTIRVQLTAQAPVGHRDEVVVLYTDDPTYPELRVPVRVQKQLAAKVRVVPEEVNLRLAAGQTEASALVQLRARDDHAIAVTSVESDLPGVVLKHSEGSGAVVTLRVTIPDHLTTQAGKCYVRVRLDDRSEVLIPVTWTGRKK